MTTPTEKPINPVEEKLSRDVDTILDLFESSGGLKVPTIDEAMFANVFLPFFANDEVKMYNVTTEMWLRIAHSPYNEVAVINRVGVELLRVPPLFDQKSFKPIDGGPTDPKLPGMFDMMQTAMNFGKQGYASMINYFNNEMSRRNHMFVRAPDADENLRRWNDIFVRYGRKPIELTTANAASVPVSQSAGFDSQEFDPLD